MLPNIGEDEEVDVDIVAPIDEDGVVADIVDPTEPNKKDDSNAEKEYSAADVLKECEAYIKAQIFIINAGSMLVDNIILMIFSYHLQENLAASTSEIGIALFFNVVLSPIRQYGVPYLAESEKTKKYCSYDKTTTYRLLVSIAILLVLSLTKSRMVFIVMGVLNSIFSVSNETTQGCISMLLPEKEAIKWQNPAILINGLTIIISSIFISIVLGVTNVEYLFYICTATYLLLFIYSCFFILGKDKYLIDRQLEFYDQKFFQEKMKRKVFNAGNKYRRKTSVAMSIAMFLNNNDASNTPNKLKGGISSALCAKYVQRIEFPIYEIKARKEMNSAASDPSTSSNGDGKKNSKQKVLSNLEWAMVVLLWLIGCFSAVPVFVNSTYTLLYLTTRFPSENVSISSLMIGTAAICSMFAIGLYTSKLSLVKRILYGDDPTVRLNDKEEMIANCWLFLLAGLGAVFLLWIHVLPYYHFGWAVLFGLGYFSVGIPSIVSIVVLILLKAEHLQSKLIAVYNAVSNIAGAIGVLVVGITWQVSIHSYLYSCIFCAGMTSVLGVALLVVASKLEVKIKSRSRGISINDSEA